MESKHLTDSEIQDHLDGNAGAETPRVMDHLRSCERCRAKLQEYRSLYAGMKDESCFDLPADFADTVVSSAGLSRSRTFLQRYAGIAISIIGTVAAFAVAFYFTDMAKVIAGASWLGWLDSFFEADIFASLREYAGNAGNTISLIVAGLSALVTIWIVDKLRIRAKRHPSSLMI